MLNKREVGKKFSIQIKNYIQSVNSTCTAVKYWLDFRLLSGSRFTNIFFLCDVHFDIYKNKLKNNTIINKKLILHFCDSSGVAKRYRV